MEFDIHRSRDGHIVVHHDDRLERTTNGHGLIGECTLAELKRLDAGRWFGSQFAGLKIPTLAEVLELAACYPRRVTLNLESKSGVVTYPNLEVDAWTMLQAFGLEDRAILSSFNHFALRNLKCSIPTARIGVLYQSRFVDPWRYAQSLGAKAIHPRFTALEPSTVEECKRQGIAVHTYTVNSRKWAKRMFQWRVDAVITNKPDVLIALRHKLNEIHPQNDLGTHDKHGL